MTVAPGRYALEVEHEPLGVLAASLAERERRDEFGPLIECEIKELRKSVLRFSLFSRVKLRFPGSPLLWHWTSRESNPCA